MEWYYALFFTCITFFVIKTVISWIAGDTDVDFDADGDVDFDVSSMFSFKGTLHYLLGFSTYLSAIAKFKYSGTEDVHFTGIEYFTGIFVGIIFMVVLFYLYKFMMKLNHFDTSEPNIDGCTCTILVNLGEGKYEVLVKTHQGMIKKVVTSDRTNIRIGDKAEIVEINKEYFI